MDWPDTICEQTSKEKPKAATQMAVGPVRPDCGKWDSLEEGDEKAAPRALLFPRPYGSRQSHDGDAKEHAGCDEAQNIRAVQVGRLDPRFAQIVQQNHRSHKRTAQTGKYATLLHASSFGPDRGLRIL
jgi:hypothetical protein